MARLAGFPGEVLADAKDFLEKAEMPILRHSQAVSSDQVATFLSTYEKAGKSGDRKRQRELIEEMKSKVFKAA